MARRSQLEGRLRAILDARHNRRPPGRAAKAMAAVLFVAALFPLAAARLTRAADADADDKTAGLGDAASPATRPAAFVATFPGGGTVELLAVARHPSTAADGPAWWSPDGSPTSRRFVTAVARQRARAGHTQMREFVVRTSGLPADASLPRWKADVPLSYDAGEARAADAKGQRMDPRLRAMAAALPDSRKTIDLRVGVAKGPWETLAENPAGEAGVRAIENRRAEKELRDVEARLRELEKLLGMNEQPGLSVGWNGTQHQLDRLLQEQARIQAELAGLRGRYATLEQDLKEGRTPAEVEREINRDPRYLRARQRVDDIDIEIDTLTRKLGERHEMVKAWMERRALYEQKMDGVRAELKEVHTASMKAMWQNEITATVANAARIDDAIQKISAKLADLNKVMLEYRALQRRLEDLPRTKAIASFAKATENADGVTVSVDHGITNADLRIVAVDSAGREVATPNVGTRDAEGGAARTTATFRGATLAKLKSFRLQARPFEWVEFPGVALDPAAPKATAASDAAVAADPELAARVRALLDVEAQLDQAEATLARAEKDAAAAAERPAAYSVEDWARVDETMAKQVQMRNELQLRIDSLEAQLGPKHAVVVRAREDLAAREKAMAAAADKLAAQFGIHWKADGSGGVLVPKDLSGLRDSVARLRDLRDRESKRLNDLRDRLRDAAPAGKLRAPTTAPAAADPSGVGG